MMQLPFEVHKLHLEDILNPEHPSSLAHQENYTLLILRLPLYQNEEVRGFSYPFLINQNTSYFYDREKQDFFHLEDNFQTLYRMLDHFVDLVIESINQAHETIEQYEEQFHSSTVRHFLREWHVQKKEMLRIHRLVSQAARTMLEFITAFKLSPHFLSNEFHDILEHLERSERSSQAALLKLDQLYSFYALTTNEKINKSIFTLTILSAIFLPLNLIVGFFGMNTGGMFFAASPSGTASVMGGMVFLSLVLSTLGFVYLRKKKAS